MVYRVPQAAPRSQVPEARRGRVIGHYCLICASIYPLHRGRHVGRPVYGRDHIASPCAHEGDIFAPGEPWWEPAAEIFPAPATPLGAAGQAARSPATAAGPAPGSAATSAAASLALPPVKGATG